MKLIMSIVNNDDANRVQDALIDHGFFVTRMSSTGGFLKKGNTTFLIGTNDDKVDAVITVIKKHANKRVVKEPTVSSSQMGEAFTPIMVDVLVGGATIFVLDIERFEKV